MMFWEYLRAVADKIEDAFNKGNLVETRRLLGLCGEACLTEKKKLDEDGVNHD